MNLTQKILQIAFYALMIHSHLGFPHGRSNVNRLSGTMAQFNDLKYLRYDSLDLLNFDLQKNQSQNWIIFTMKELKIKTMESNYFLEDKKKEINQHKEFVLQFDALQNFESRIRIIESKTQKQRFAISSFINKENGYQLVILPENYKSKKFFIHQDKNSILIEIGQQDIEYFTLDFGKILNRDESQIDVLKDVKTELETQNYFIQNENQWQGYIEKKFLINTIKVFQSSDHNDSCHYDYHEVVSLQLMDKHFEKNPIKNLDEYYLVLFNQSSFQNEVTLWIYGKNLNHMKCDNFKVMFFQYIDSQWKIGQLLISDWQLTFLFGQKVVATTPLTDKFKIEFENQSDIQEISTKFNSKSSPYFRKYTISSGIRYILDDIEKKVKLMQISKKALENKYDENELRLLEESEEDDKVFFNENEQIQCLKELYEQYYEDFFTQMNNLYKNQKFITTADFVLEKFENQACISNLIQLMEQIVQKGSLKNLQDQITSLRKQQKIDSQQKIKYELNSKIQEFIIILGKDNEEENWKESQREKINKYDEEQQKKLEEIEKMDKDYEKILDDIVKKIDSNNKKQQYEIQESTQQNQIINQELNIEQQNKEIEEMNELIDKEDFYFQISNTLDKLIEDIKKNYNVISIEFNQFIQLILNSKHPKPHEQ